MLWLWIVGPIAALAIFVLTGPWFRSRFLGRTNVRFMREIEAWRAAMGARRAAELGEAPAKKKKKTADRATGETKKKKKSTRDLQPKRVPVTPAGFSRVLQGVGEGAPLGHYELVKDVAYVVAMEGSIGGTSDHQTVLLRLDNPGPRMIVRPLPLGDTSTGIQFRKDPAFMAAFLVEGQTSDAKAIGKWLSKPLREMLLETPDAWLRVEGGHLALTIYGFIDAEKLEELIDLADVFCAEHGAQGGPSLVTGEAAARPARRAAKDEDDEDADEDEDGEDEDEDDEDEAPAAKGAPAARPKA
ncbi:hypothetical protein [Polyangium aurulentum]|uniref:hypothetical protein n=1 Tax=Polyangium aurulentum TaxID=2567896 RepID=UPI0010ADE322|nr:hypothetical protein [Polyangium aurulentum]UQA62542.1 hypothetical protein E8A73_019640 [Polyangium aurulentum]